jgi:hypothetical protein
MRGFGIRYARLHHQPKHLRMAFVDVASAEGWHEVVERFYNLAAQAV